jgi:hypothetical protein
MAACASQEHWSCKKSLMEKPWNWSVQLSIERMKFGAEIQHRFHEKNEISWSNSGKSNRDSCHPEEKKQMLLCLQKGSFAEQNTPKPEIDL